MYNPALKPTRFRYVPTVGLASRWATQHREGDLWTIKRFG